MTFCFVRLQVREAKTIWTSSRSVRRMREQHSTLFKRAAAVHLKTHRHIALVPLDGSVYTNVVVLCKTFSDGMKFRLDKGKTSKHI